MRAYVTVIDERGHGYSVPLWKLPEYCAQAREVKRQDLAKAEDEKRKAEELQRQTEAAQQFQAQPNFQAPNPFADAESLGDIPGETL